MAHKTHRFAWFCFGFIIGCATCIGILIASIFWTLLKQRAPRLPPPEAASCSPQ